MEQRIWSLLWLVGSYLLGSLLKEGRVVAVSSCAGRNNCAGTSSSTVGPSASRSWNLTDLVYPSPYDLKIDQDVAALQMESEAFHKSYNMHLNLANIGQALGEYERLCIVQTRIELYLNLKGVVPSSDTQLSMRLEKVSHGLNKIFVNGLAFFPIEVSKLEGANAARYTAWISEEKNATAHYLSAEVERALAVRSGWGGMYAVTKMYKKALTSSYYNISQTRLDSVEKHTELSLAQLLFRLRNQDQEIRLAALRSLRTVLVERGLKKVAGAWYNTVAGIWHIENTERNYTNLRNRRYVADGIPSNVVATMLTAVREYAVPLAKRHLRLVKTILKKTVNLMQFTWADRNAPLSLAYTGKVYEWDEAQRIVERVFIRLSPTMATLFVKMLVDGKAQLEDFQKISRASTFGGAPGFGPYLLLNFTRCARGVMTLAREAGHGSHYILAYEKGYLQSRPPATLAGIAGVFGQAAVFDEVLGKATSELERLGMLVMRSGDLLEEVMRSSILDRFEELIYTKRSLGGVDIQYFDDMWVQTIKEHYGQEGEIIDNYWGMEHLWAMAKDPDAKSFSSYTDVFTGLVGGALYGAFSKSSEGFEAKLLELMRNSGSDDVATLLQPFGINPAQKWFWGEALKSSIGNVIDAAERLAGSLNLAPMMSTMDTANVTATTSTMDTSNVTSSTGTSDWDQDDWETSTVR